MEQAKTEHSRDMTFALDIGTRSIIGVVGRAEGDRFHVLAIEKQEHSKRAMMDGQIEDIEQVARVVKDVTARLEQRLECKLKRVCIAAAGRALRTEKGHFSMELPKVRRISDELIGQLEAGAVSSAETALHSSMERQDRFFLVGYTVSRYLLDDYPMSTLRGHNGQKLEADVVATFLPAEVVESLYSAMKAADLEVASLTLEPIAAINAAIPRDLRLLNLVMVDIGAGTSDIAVCRDGSVVGYTMATVAGDEITESIMRAYLVDFATAERIKSEAGSRATIRFTDILGLDQELDPQELVSVLEEPVRELAEELGRRIRDLNGGPPSAVFLAGGGSKLGGVRQAVSAALEMDERRVAIAGNNFKLSAFADHEELNDPEYATPLGIAVSAGLGLISDSYRLTLNGQPAKLFRSGTLTALDLLLMNGYVYNDLIGRTGQSLVVNIDGKRKLLRGEPATPSVLKINGEEKPASTVIQSGDVIDFTPARSGASAARTLEELLGTDGAAEALVNGVPVAPDRPLKSGDEIQTHAVVPVTVPLSVPEETKESLEPMDKDTDRTEAPAEDERTGEREPQSEQDTTVPPASHEEKAAEPVQPAPSSAEAPDGQRMFFLNGQALVMPKKPNNEPYYLMDMLDRSGIDFEHLESRVILQVNGAEGQFTQILQDGDAVVIRTEDSRDRGDETTPQWRRSGR